MRFIFRVVRARLVPNPRRHIRFVTTSALQLLAQFTVATAHIRFRAQYREGTDGVAKQHLAPDCFCFPRQECFTSNTTTPTPICPSFRAERMIVQRDDFLRQQTSPPATQAPFVAGYTEDELIQRQPRSLALPSVASSCTLANGRQATKTPAHDCAALWLIGTSDVAALMYLSESQQEPRQCALAKRLAPKDEAASRTVYWMQCSSSALSLNLALEWIVLVHVSSRWWSVALGESPQVNFALGRVRPAPLIASSHMSC